MKQKIIKTAGLKKKQQLKCELAKRHTVVLSNGPWIN